ncbi:EamA family transporter [Marinoscillum sp.]|uniref:EamA family transporter n=1 Tax=Marinoscillum sp. TaxID=2024838 RepID=UPI003BAD974E
MGNKTLRYFLAFAAIYLIWGTTYLAIVIGLRTIPPFLMASMRFAIAAILLIGYSLLKGEGIPSLASLTKNAIIGTTVLAGGQGLLIWSEQHIASGYASVLVATLPVWFIVYDRSNWTYYRQKPSILIGVALGFTGIGVLFWEQLNESDDNTSHLQILASILVLVGAMCWVAGTLYNRSKPAVGSIYKNLGWQLAFGCISCLIISLVLGESFTSLSSASLESLLAVVYLAVAGSIIAYVAYTWLLSEFPSAIVSTYAYINPVVAVFLGWLLAEERISTQQIGGMIIILTSAILINRNR